MMRVRGEEERQYPGRRTEPPVVRVGEVVLSVGRGRHCLSVLADPGDEGDVDELDLALEAVSIVGIEPPDQLQRAG